MADIEGQKARSLGAVEDQARKEARRKAGEQYLETVLAQAKQGRNPYQADAAARRKATPKAAAVDADMEVIGKVVSGAGTYVLGTLYASGHSLTVALLWGSLQQLRTPATQTFLHLMPATLLLWLTADVEPPTLEGLQAALVPTVLTGVQVLCACTAATSCSVYLLLALLTYVPQLAAFERAFLLDRQPLSVMRTLCLAIGAAAAAPCLVAQQLPSVLAASCLAVWCLAAAAREIWAHVLQHPGPLPGWPDSLPWSRLTDLAARQSALGDGTVAFYSHAVPAVPILLLGFLCQEGRMVVEHELSVPAVSLMMMSWAAFAVAAMSGAKLGQRITPQRRHQLQGTAALSSLVPAAAVEGLPSVLGIVCTLMAVLGAATSAFLADS